MTLASVWSFETEPLDLSPSLKTKHDELAILAEEALAQVVQTTARAGIANDVLVGSFLNRDPLSWHVLYWQRRTAGCIHAPGPQKCATQRTKIFQKDPDRLSYCILWGPGIHIAEWKLARSPMSWRSAKLLRKSALGLCPGRGSLPYRKFAGKDGGASASLNLIKLSKARVWDVALVA